MCIKDPNNIFQPVKLRLISGTINDYPGNIPDLNGCDADGKQAKETLLRYWSDFDIRRYRETQFNLKNFKLAVTKSIASLSPGAVVVVFADSCFSGGLSRDAFGLGGNTQTRNRFYAQPGIEIKPQIRTFVTSDEITWIVMAGCGPAQYCADAWLNNSYHGAYSWHAFNSLQPGMTYREWHTEIMKYLPGKGFEQIPVLEGPARLFNKVIGEDQTLIIHNSSHGTQVMIKGVIHEAICLYNYNLTDTEYISWLSKISA